MNSHYQALHQRSRRPCLASFSATTVWSKSGCRQARTSSPARIASHATPCLSHPTWQHLPLVLPTTIGLPMNGGGRTACSRAKYLEIDPGVSLGRHARLNDRHVNYRRAPDRGSEKEEGGGREADGATVRWQGGSERAEGCSVFRRCEHRRRLRRPLGVTKGSTDNPDSLIQSRTGYCGTLGA